MTPKERAELAYEDWREGTTVGHPAWSHRIDDLPVVIAKYIRDAHNAAIDQAALLAHGYQKEKILELKV